MNKVKIGITGALGYIGSRLAKDSLEEGNEVVGVDNLSLSKINKIEGAKTENIDIKNLRETEEALKGCDIIYHLAAFPGLDNCKRDPELGYDTNIIGTQNISWICYKCGIPLIFVSSMAIFGDPKEFPITENHPIDPQNLYAKMKLMGMRAVETFSKDSFPSYIFILCNVYGDHEVDGKTVTKERIVINKFSAQAKRGEKLTVFSPGDQARSFINVKDVSAALLKSKDKIIHDEKKTKIFNLASQCFSVLEVANLIKELKPDTEIEIVKNPREDETTVKNFEVSTEKIKNYLGFTPKVKIEDAIKEMISE